MPPLASPRSARHHTFAADSRQAAFFMDAVAAFAQYAASWSRNSERSTMNRFVMAAVLFAVPTAVAAADAQGKFTTDGIGAESCQRFIGEREKKSNFYFMFAGWLDGYMSALNQYTGDTFDITPWESSELLMALIERHCRQNPDDQYIKVVVSLAKTLNNDKLTEESFPVDATVGDKTVRIYQAVMARAQSALKAAGHYAGDVDGQFGPNTQTAFEAFQTAMKIEVTGLPDQQTLLALFRPAPPAQGELQP